MPVWWMVNVIDMPIKVVEWAGVEQIVSEDREIFESALMELEKAGEEYANAPVLYRLVAFAVYNYRTGEARLYHLTYERRSYTAKARAFP